MDTKITKKKGGRPPTKPADKLSNCVMLRFTDKEIAQLRKEHEGYTVSLATFLRHKLLGREAIDLAKPIDSEIQVLMTNILKMAGSVKLLALRTERDELLSASYREVADELRQIVLSANFQAKELVLNQSTLGMILTEVRRLKKLLENEVPREQVKEVCESIERVIKSKLVRYALNESTENDRKNS